MSERRPSLRGTYCKWQQAWKNYTCRVDQKQKRSECEAVGPSCGGNGGGGGAAQHEAISGKHDKEDTWGWGESYGPLHHTLAKRIILTDDSLSLLEWAVEHVCPRQEACQRGASGAAVGDHKPACSSSSLWCKKKSALSKPFSVMFIASRVF